ncbi:MAG: type IX secretion system PorP/SprF family membrane protein [Limisphaerales bacterium]|jgi:type IX secretion system PorP/SprF family membrane protein
MKKINTYSFCLVFLLFTLVKSELSAQQDYQFTQFNFNKLALNPAYAGTDNLISLTGVYRKQWTGIDGAPQSISFSGHAPVFHERVGFGVLIYDDRIGVDHQVGLFTTYSYKVPLGGSVLSFGLQAGVLNYKSELTALDPLNSGDIAFSQNYSAIHPNFGVGLYWYKPKTAFVGISIPRLIENDLTEVGVIGTSSLYRHSYLMAGYVFRISKLFSLRPSALFKYDGPNVTQAPISSDINLSVLLSEKLWLGAGYRIGDSFDAMAEFLVTDQFMLGYSYDFGTSTLSQFHSGAHEVVLRYDFNFKKDAFVSPRQIKYF